MLKTVRKQSYTFEMVYFVCRFEHGMAYLPDMQSERINPVTRIKCA